LALPVAMSNLQKWRCRPLSPQFLVTPSGFGLGLHGLIAGPVGGRDLDHDRLACRQCLGRRRCSRMPRLARALRPLHHGSPPPRPRPRSRRWPGVGVRPLRSGLRAITTSSSYRLNTRSPTLPRICSMTGLSFTSAIFLVFPEHSGRRSRTCKRFAVMRASFVHPSQILRTWFVHPPRPDAGCFTDYRMQDRGAFSPGTPVRMKNLTAVDERLKTRGNSRHGRTALYGTTGECLRSWRTGKCRLRFGGVRTGSPGLPY